MDQTKLVEFRKTSLPASLQTIVVYATAPVSEIIGYVNVENIVESTPQMIWKKYCSVGGIGRKKYFEYFSGSDRAIAIEVGSVHRLQIAQTLSVIEVKRAPQSFQYLSHQQLDVLRDSRRVRAA